MDKKIKSVIYYHSLQELDIDNNNVNQKTIPCLYIPLYNNSLGTTFTFSQHKYILI